jgi:hypothetical protein
MICKNLNGKDAVCDQAEDGAIAVEMMKERMRGGGRLASRMILII